MFLWFSLTKQDKLNSLFYKVDNLSCLASLLNMMLHAMEE